VLLRSEPFARGVPDGAAAWRILYTTTRGDQTPPLASGLVLVSEDAPAGRRPVIAWAHGTTGFDRKCAPSLLPKPFEAGATPALSEIVANGWVLVATDYVGLGTAGPHPYLIGEPVARSVLDSVRAARQLNDVELEERIVVWGHSQGGHAALWTGILAPEYAPDVDVIGVAALSPAAALQPLMAAAKDRLVGRILGSYVMSAYDAIYPDVDFDDYVRAPARILARATARRCLSGPEALVSVATAVGRESWFSRDPSEGALGVRLAENTPNRPIETPLMVGQGLDDPLVRTLDQRRFVDEICSAGRQVEYHTYDGFGHVDLVLERASPLIDDLLAWTRERLDGLPPQPGCRTVEG
jgi:acetyl esterase/lipase